MTAHRSTYADRIAELAPTFDPRHVEAFMRSAHPTLDHLDAVWFAREVRIACQCVTTGGEPFAEQIARSYGLNSRPKKNKS